jgi:hypothetical protein
VNWIEQIVTAFLRWLTGLAKDDTTATDAKPQPDLRNHLHRRIADHEQRVRESGDSGAQR